MQGIDNLSMLKLKMKTSEYWADHWAVSTLERELNIKTIIFCGFFMSLYSSSTIPLALRLKLFRLTALLDTFLDTTKPI